MVTGIPLKSLERKPCLQTSSILPNRGWLATTIETLSRLLYWRTSLLMLLTAFFSAPIRDTALTCI